MSSAPQSTTTTEIIYRKEKKNKGKIQGNMGIILGSMKKNGLSIRQLLT